MASKVTPLRHLVVIGSSAGGIDALSTLVATLPTDFPAPIVIAQHLDPNRPSHLAEILGRRSTLPVRTSGEHEHLEPGVIYVVPSNRQIHITDSAIELQEDSAGRFKPSIDLLLTSAAEVYGERLIAVILSGTGTDGAAGARTVKKAGGTVIIQDPDTATYPGMPLSLAPNTVDIVATLERMGHILRDLIAGVPVPTRPDEKKALEAFLEEVRTRYGLDFNSYKTPTILRRLQRRIVATDTENLEGYVQYLDTHPEEYPQLINAFLIKVTEFFRDPELFAYLRDEVLPDIIKYARSRDNEIRIWSAGCATGEEAYSLAILMSEALGAELDQFNVRIFATDVDAEAVAFARRGIYPASALSGVPEELITRYFSKDENHFQIKKRVRSLTVFGQHDLGQRAPFPNIDMAVCRNVMIYFTPDLQQRTLQLFAYSLRDGGYLVLGKAESTSPLSEFYVLQHKQHKVYRRQGDRILMPLARFTTPTPAPPQRLALTRRTPSGHESGQRQKEVMQRVRNINESVLLRLPVGLVVVDRHYDIQGINSAARGYLAIHGAAVGEDLIHLTQSPSTQRLRAAVDLAFRMGTDATVDEFAIEEVTTGDLRYLQIVCHPQRSEGERSMVDSAMVVIYDITALIQRRQLLERQLQETTHELEQIQTARSDEAARQEQLMQRLVETNRQLVEANQELTSSNEELRTTNEEFLLSTEEAQAATEEVETLNEELQATNEELETLNEELQSTIEELNTTNDDLHARSQELQDMAHVSVEERARLEAILSSMPSALLVVNRDGALTMSNPAYAEMFGGPDEQFMARDEDGHLLPPGSTPRERAARGESFRMEFTLTDADGTRRWFEAIGQPIHSPGNEQQAGVVAIRDITERSIHRLQDEFMSLASHELRTPLTPLQGTLQLLLKQVEGLPADAPQRRYAERALRQTRQLVRMVDDLLDVGRLQTGKYTLNLAPVRLDELVAQTVEVAQTTATSQTIHLEVQTNPLSVSGDTGRLEQILLNLLNNAMTYAPQSKQIDVRVRQVENEAEVQVQDYGQGIPQADLPHLFSRFYQAARSDRQTKRGLGLGLYIVRELVTAHNGRISVDSSEGKGTTFTIRLPLLLPEKEGQPAPKDAPGGSSKPFQR
ncbi:MAG TPA: chemotaxis protein CheB [Ktedonobacterales bacterium]|nr:chemotaxis protein CheB [Ktedonobacterales bacterium]